MKKLLMILTIIAITSQITNANQIYSTQKLGNGQVINRCRFSNGTVDYCTMGDALRAMDAFNNPQKYMSKEELAKYQKNTQQAQNRLNSIFPLYNESINKNKELDKEIKNLQYKQNLGVSIDSKTLNLLIYKQMIIHYLNGYINMADNSAALGIDELKIKYEDLFRAIDNKSISQSEYDEAIANLKKQADILKTIYDKGMALTLSPDENALNWVELNYPGSYSYAEAKRNGKLLYSNPKINTYINVR